MNTIASIAFMSIYMRERESSEVNSRSKHRIGENFSRKFSHIESVSINLKVVYHFKLKWRYLISFVRKKCMEHTGYITRVRRWKAFSLGTLTQTNIRIFFA